MFAHMKSLHISLNTAHQTANQALPCHPSQFFPSLPIPLLTSHPCHLHLSTSQHPIIHTPTLQMPKPPQSAMPHHIRHTLYTQKTIQIHTELSIFQQNSAHPSHHHPLQIIIIKDHENLSKIMHKCTYYILLQRS